MIASGDIISQAEAAKRLTRPPPAVQSPCARVRLRLGDLSQLLCPGRASESYNKLSFKADSNGNCLTPGTVQSKIQPEISPPRLSVINMARSGFQDILVTSSSSTHHSLARSGPRVVPTFLETSYPRKTLRLLCPIQFRQVLFPRCRWAPILLRGARSINRRKLFRGER
jgi:hypothetical protein